MNQIVCVKLMTDEEIVGHCLKEYSEGDLRIQNALLVVDTPDGQYLDKFLLGGRIEDILEIRAHAIITHCQASPKLVTLFTDTIEAFAKEMENQVKPH